MIRLATVAFSLLLTSIVVPVDDDPRQSDDNKIVVLVRHAEKCKTDGRDPALTDFGVQRAHDLARAIEYLEIDRIYSTPFKRTTETARPSSETFGVEIDITPLSKSLIADVAEAVKNDDRNSILVVGHSNTTTRVVNELVGTNLPDIEDEDYDHLFVVSLPDSGTASLQRFRYGAESGPVEQCN